MARVEFTRHLHRFFPALDCERGVPVEDAADVAAVLRGLDARYPGLRDYIVDDSGALRKHVNVFVDEKPVRDRTTLSDPVGPASDVLIMQALSGG